MKTNQTRRGRRPQYQRGSGLYHVRLWLEEAILDGRGATFHEAIANLRALWVDHGHADAPTETDPPPFT